jgi:hypothetical protein
LCQRLCKCQKAALLCRIVRRKGCEHADAADAFALLRAAIGHAAAAPPSVAKNFRRSMWLAM